MNVVQENLAEGQYFTQKHSKTMIVLHHTSGGSAQSSIQWWKTENNKVAVAYVVDRDGTIYQAFPDDCWAYHLGLHNVPTGELDQRSIGIEISCAGGLSRDAEGVLRAFDKTSGPAFQAPVTNLEKAWRGYQFFESYTEQQYVAVCDLVASLLVKYPTIQKKTPKLHNDFAMPALRYYNGIVTHCQLRADKSDCHPGFPWDAFVAKLNLALD